MCFKLILLSMLCLEQSQFYAGNIQDICMVNVFSFYVFFLFSVIINVMHTTIEIGPSAICQSII